MPLIFRPTPSHFARLIRHLQRHGFQAVDVDTEPATVEDLWLDVQTGIDTIRFYHHSELNPSTLRPLPNAHRFWLFYDGGNGPDNPSDYGDTPLHGWSSAITSFIDSESARHP